MTNRKFKYHTAAYFPEWEEAQPYYVKQIDSRGSAEKITIINYAFGLPGPDEDSGIIIPRLDNAEAAYTKLYSAEMSVDGEADRADQPLRGHFNQLRKLKTKHPHIQVLPSLGGWTGSGWFSDAARTVESRRRFVAACIDLYIHGNLPYQDGAGGPGAAAGVFDGIDIDWEYPQSGGLPENHVHPDDPAHFVALLAEFRRQFAEIGRPELLLTAAVPGPAQAAQFNMAEAHHYLDLVALMTYDLYHGWSPSSGHHTNLLDSDFDPAPIGQRLSADATVRVYRDTYGVPPEKLLLGAAFYGRAWRVAQAGPQHGLYQPGEPVSLDDGGMFYHSLADHAARDFERYWDDTAQAPWLWRAADRTFCSYDDLRSIEAKANYVRQQDLGGIMFWEITGDDEKGSMVAAIERGLMGQRE
jgi:chitinase